MKKMIEEIKNLEKDPGNGVEITCDHSFETSCFDAREITLCRVIEFSCPYEETGLLSNHLRESCEWQYGLDSSGKAALLFSFKTEEKRKIKNIY